jgi:DNA-binding Lrp family transcriptional regulator
MKNALHSLDLAIALRLAEGAATYERLEADLGSSRSQVHAAVKRLRLAGLLRPDSMDVNRHQLLEFVLFGAKYAFPVRPGLVVRGVPTAHSAPALAEHIEADDQLVWPSVHGDVVGESIEPLYPRAPELPTRAPATYRLLTLVDALRVGRARERALARQLLEAAIIGSEQHAA